MSLFGKYICYCHNCGWEMTSDKAIGKNKDICSIECVRMFEKKYARSILGLDTIEVEELKK